MRCCGLHEAVEDELEGLVRDAGVIVHPGSFYGMAGKNRVVVSLIGPEERFRGDGKAEAGVNPES